MRILIVEDDREIAESLRKCLISENFAVDLAEDGEKGVFLARTNSYDVVLLDYNLPKMDGKQVCKTLRGAGYSVPIIMLTVNTEVENKVDMLNLGVDDYVAKPFSLEELVARIRALLRRPAALLDETLAFEDIELSPQRHEVKRGGERVVLTRKEFMMLEYLLREKGRVVTRSMLTEHVWDSNLDPFSNTIESHVLSLRKKIEGPGRKKLIFTVPGKGYKLDTNP